MGRSRPAEATQKIAKAAMDHVEKRKRDKKREAIAKPTAQIPGAEGP